MGTMSGHSTVDIITHPISDRGMFPPQSPSLVYEGWMHHWSHNIPRNAYHPQVDLEVSGPHPSIVPMPNVYIDEQTGAPLPEELVTAILDEDFPVVPPFNSTVTCMTSFPELTLPPYTPPYTPPMSTSGGPEIFETMSTPSTLSEAPAYSGIADVDSTPDWDQDGVSMDISSDEGTQYTHVDTMSNASVPSSCPVVSRTPPVAQYEAQEASRDMPHQVQKTGKGPAVASSPPSRRPAVTRASAKHQHSCNICWKTYSQPQGVRRHQRETHKASLCVYCHSFEWGRPYRLRQHIKKWHPDVVDIDAALEEASEMRRKVTKDPRCLSRQQVSVSPPTPQHDGQIRAVVPVPQPDHPLEPTAPTSHRPPPAVAKLPPAIPSRGLLPEARHPNYTDPKAEEVRPLRKKIAPAPGSGCGIHSRRHARGFGSVI